MSGYLRRQYLEFLKDDPSAEWRQQLVEDHNPIRTVNEISDGRVDAWKGVDWFIDCGEGGHDWNYWRPSLVRALKHMSDVFRSINHKK